MFQPHSAPHRARRGFSLVELAIVVGVTGLLFGGLWRLMSTGNSQLREQTAADQMNQVVTATRNFLAAPEGLTLLQALANGGTGTLALPLAATPAGNAGCAAAMAAGTGTYCNFLPAGFSAASTNSYGQTYQVMYRRNDGGTAGNPAQNYDFLIFTQNGDIIPDNAGGRIAANLGANGGFIFSNNTCGAAVATTGCGAYGSYTLDLSAAGPYGATGGGSGRIITLNNSTVSAGANANWLARVGIPGDFGVNTPPIFNTMRVPLNMLTGGTATLNMYGNQLNLNDGAAAGGGGTILMQQGTLQGPGQISINNGALLTSAIDLDYGASVANTSSAIHVKNLAAPSTVVDIQASTTCDPQASPLTCNWGIGVSGSAFVTEYLNANQMRAATFIYTSDMRMKRDLVKIPNALDRLTQLNGYRFVWKKDGQADLGVVAQEVKEVFPELVHESSTPGHMGVEYGNLVAPMIEALKELKDQNAMLKQQLDRQQTEINALRKR